MTMQKHQPIKLGTIENAGPNTLVAFLRNAGAACAQIDIGVAFVTAAGLDSLLYLLKKAASRGSVRVLTGLYQGFTEPKALRTLLMEQKRADGRFSVRVSREQRFHWKAYILVGRNTASVVIGSSNLTEYGLHESGELNVVLSFSTKSQGFLELRRVYEQHWNDKSIELTDEIVTKYEDWRKEAGLIFKTRSVPIRKILGAERSKRPEATAQVRYWRYCIDGHLEDETVDLLGRTTDWDRRKYEYFSTWRPSFQPGDKVIVFDLSANRIEAIEIKNTTKTPERTPDGSHFAAYRTIKGYARRLLVQNRWKALKAAGLLKRNTDAEHPKRLSKVRFDLFLEQLKK
jgi:HKD family nuclease